MVAIAGMDAEDVTVNRLVCNGVGCNGSVFAVFLVRPTQEKAGAIVLRCTKCGFVVSEPGTEIRIQTTKGEGYAV